MKRKFAFACAAVGAIVFAKCGAAADLYVIAHPTTAIAADDVKDVYVGEKQFGGNVKLVPTDNPAAKALFLERVLRMDDGRHNTVWIKKGFRDGILAPAQKSGDSAVIEFVRSTPGAVGYVTSAPASVTIVQKY